MSGHDTRSDTFPYRSAAAFRAALRDRLAALARSGGHGLDELQRQVAYDRLLARAFTAPDAERWVLKGAGALLARLPEARHSRDIDLAFATRATTRPDETERAADDAVSSLQAAINTDLGDFFRFEIPRTSPIDEAVKGRRIHVVAYLGARYASFHVDVVVGTAMTGTPQAGPPLVQLHIPGLLRPDYRLFPLPDHIADKLCAITEVHNRLDGPHASTRVKDLVDLVLIAGTQRVDAAALSLAIRVGTAHRGLPLPRRFTVPDLELWRRGYPARAKEAAIAVPDFETAVRTVGALLNPILDGTALGTWNPDTARWDQSPVSRDHATAGTP
jgi:Nucleotidyl transferase AbiEii toxin, Type IV TA system